MRSCPHLARPPCVLCSCRPAAAQLPPTCQQGPRRRAMRGSSEATGLSPTVYGDFKVPDLQLVPVDQASCQRCHVVTVDKHYVLLLFVMTVLLLLSLYCCCPSWRMLLQPGKYNAAAASHGLLLLSFIHCTAASHLLLLPVTSCAAAAAIHALLLDRSTHLRTGQLETV